MKVVNIIKKLLRNLGFVINKTVKSESNGLSMCLYAVHSNGFSVKVEFHKPNFPLDPATFRISIFKVSEDGNAVFDWHPRYEAIFSEEMERYESFAGTLYLIANNHYKEGTLGDKPVIISIP